LRAPSQRLGKPVGDVAAGIAHIVGPDVLDSALALGEHLELAAWRIDQLVVGLVCVIDRDLASAIATERFQM
jgi:hypothetical protein